MIPVKPFMSRERFYELIRQQPKLKEPPVWHGGFVTKPDTTSATFRWISWRDYCREMVKKHPNCSKSEWYRAWLEQAEAVVEWRRTLPKEDWFWWSGIGVPPKE